MTYSIPPRCLAYLFIVLAYAPGLAVAGSGSSRVLFAFDDRALPFQQGVRLQMIGFNAPLAGAMPGNIVVPPGPPGSPDSIGCYYYGSVQRVGDELWMWYLGCGDRDPQPLDHHLRVCLAKSKDGRQWEKPALGLVDYGGTKQNNLVSRDGQAFDAVVESVVLRDPDDPDPERRFKMAYEDEVHYGMRLAVAYSPDGIHWKQSPHNPVGPWCEMSGLIKWHGAYIVSAQAKGNWVPNGKSARVMDNLVSYDFEHWYPVPAVGFRRDSLPPRSPNFLGGVDGEQVHLGASLWNRGNIVIGFYGQWHGVPTNDRAWVSIDLGLIVSHDGLHYYEPDPDFRVVEARENVFGWPSINLISAPAVSQGEGFVNLGDHTLFWYGIWNNPHGGVRLATWERDRLGCLEPFTKPGEPASVTSEPIDLSQPAEVFLNVSDLNRLSSVKVSLLDRTFRPLAGFSSANGTGPTAPGLRQKATWTGGSRIPAGTPFRIRVDFGGDRPEDVKLYAIYVTPAG